MIELAQNELNYGQSIGGRVIIGVETNNVEPENVTFFEEGEVIMKYELAIVKEHYRTNSAFDGFAIHDYSGYLVLAPVTWVYLPVIVKDR